MLQSLYTYLTCINVEENVHLYGQWDGRIVQVLPPRFHDFTEPG